MSDESAQERCFRLAAGRCGLKLIRDRTACRSLYSLRPLWVASHAVGRLPDGRLGLTKAPNGRHKVACWLPLADIERLLASWSESMPGGWGQPSAWRGRKRDPRRRHHSGLSAIPSEVLQQGGAAQHGPI